MYKEEVGKTQKWISFKKKTQVNLENKCKKYTRECVEIPLGTVRRLTDSKLCIFHEVLLLMHVMIKVAIYSNNLWNTVYHTDYPAAAKTLKAA